MSLCQISGKMQLMKHDNVPVRSSVLADVAQSSNKYTSAAVVFAGVIYHTAYLNGRLIKNSK